MSPLPEKTTFKKPSLIRVKDNRFAADLAEMGLLSSENWGVKYLFCMVDISNKYVCVKPCVKAKTVLHGR